MTVSTPVEQIVEMLGAANYRRLDNPLNIAGVRFDFPAVLVGIEPAPDLVVIADTTLEADDRIRSKLEGLARALDVVRSKRPVTAILAGPRPRSSVLDGMSKVCRVLPIGSAALGAEESALRNWLAVLMPLTLPQRDDAIADPMKSLVDQIDLEDPLNRGVFDASQQGTAEVEAKLHSLIREPLLELGGDDF